MESLLSSLQSVVDYAVPMIVLLGLLIFVHELGHFLVAKYYKVRVEVFSLGFGPKLLKYKHGDTVYAISLIPFGGYVKMFGDDPSAEIDDAQRAVSFNHKPVGQRIAVVLAGPLMNLFFAIVVFSAVALIGEQVLAPVVGDISEKSQAYALGFRSGDRVVAVDQAPIASWDQLQKAIEQNPDRAMSVSVVHADGDAAAPQAIDVRPKLVDSKTPLTWDRSVGEVEGLTPSSRSTFIGVRDPASSAALAGFKTGDHIKSVNGVPITKWRELLSSLAGSGKRGIQVEVERGLLDEKTAENPQLISGTISTEASGSGEQVLADVGIEFPELYLAGVEKGAPADLAGLKEGDRVVSIDGQAIESFDQIAERVRAYGKRSETESADSGMNVVFSRDGQQQTVALKPKLNERMSAHGTEEKKYEIGIRPLIVDALPATAMLKADGPVSALQRGTKQTWHWTSMTVLSFVRLFQAKVSPKNIGGFLSIGAMAKRSWQIGPSQFLIVMGIISINLFILNLLPVPVLDGGHLVFYTIEAIKGAPLSMRKMEIAQQVGLVLLLVLMVFAFYNDVTRIFVPH